MDARDLELGRGLRARIAADAHLRQVVGQHLALLEQRRHQPVGHAPVRRALAHGVDARVRHGLQRVADHDAALHVQVHLLGQRGLGPDAHGHDHQRGRCLAPVLQVHAGHAAPAVARQRPGLGLHQKAHAALGQRGLQQGGGGLVQLAVQQAFACMHHGDVHAALHESVGGLQAQQAAADDHGMAVAGGRRDHGLGVGNVAVAQHAFQLAPGHGQHEGARARGQDQPVVLGAHRLSGRVHGVHHAARPVDCVHAAARMQGDAVLRIPGPVVEDDLVQLLLARQHGRQHDAVVVGVGLGPEYRDLVEVGRDLEQLLQRAHAGHAVAHHHQPGFFHRAPVAVRKTKKASPRCAADGCARGDAFVPGRGTSLRLALRPFMATPGI